LGCSIIVSSFGDWKKANSFALKLLTLLPDSSNGLNVTACLYHIAKTEQELGNQKDACHYAERALGTKRDKFANMRLEDEGIMGGIRKILKKCRW
jgi:hypothetical protein